MEQDIIGTGEFKAHCLKLIDKVGKSRRPLIITKRGKPVARLMPVEQPGETRFGAMKGTITIEGDIIGPFHDVWMPADDDSHG